MQILKKGGELCLMTPGHADGIRMLRILSYPFFEITLDAVGPGFLLQDAQQATLALFCTWNC